MATLLIAVGRSNMSLTSFRIAQVKAVSLASCESVPRVMVIAGPNGVGKSTVLYELSRKRGTVFDKETAVLYQPPHRAIRATTVQRRYTFGGAMRWFWDLLAHTEVSGFDGLSISQPARTPDNVDEAGSTIKYSLGRLENRYQTALAQRVQREKLAAATHLNLTEIPDIYEPLRTFTEFLLPHLKFDRLDVSDESNIKCLWTRSDVGGSISLDIDQLSSGEKSMVTLFLPLLESDISALLNKIDPTQGPTGDSDALMVIDEPEQHIHPDLQARVMTYLRGVAAAKGTQFIVSTHSPTILDQAWDDELFVLVPRTAEAGDNQLKKVATSLERLEALRQLTGGNTFVVTTGRSIVCVEGRSADAADPSDVRLLEIMYPRATAYTFVPVGNKANVIGTVAELRERLPEDVFKIRVFGITDRDRSGTGQPGVVTWPVCMIENLMLQPSLLSRGATELGADGDWSEPAVTALLDELTALQHSDEIGLRVSNILRAQTIRPRGDSVEAVLAGLDTQLAPFDRLRQEPETVHRAIEQAKNDVDQIIKSGGAIKFFRGKPILRAVYGRAFPTGRVSYSQFVHGLAVRAETEGNIQRTLETLFNDLERSDATAAVPVIAEPPPTALPTTHPEPLPTHTE